MAEVARRAGVGRGTLYRNFPGRRELLEALFRDEVDALVDAAVPSDDNPGDALLGWLHRLAAFEGSKHAIASELLESTDSANPMFGSSRQRVISAGEPLLAAAQLAGHVRRDITLVQALDLVLAVVRLDREPDQIAVILQVALDGLRAGSR
jgi:AcrR family transcriptional regulator